MINIFQDFLTNRKLKINTFYVYFCNNVCLSLLINLMPPATGKKKLLCENLGGRYRPTMFL